MLLRGILEVVFPLTAVVTNDEVDLRAKFEFQIPVAHEVDHFDFFDDTHLSNTLGGGISRWRRNGRKHIHRLTRSVAFPEAAA